MGTTNEENLLRLVCCPGEGLPEVDRMK
jgi:hypothetical protein